MSENGWRSRVHGLASDPAGRVLLLESEHGRTLPRVDVDGRAVDDLERARRALSEGLGTESRSCGASHAIATTTMSYRHIRASVEPGSIRELEWALPYWLRKVVEVDFDALPG